MLYPLPPLVEQLRRNPDVLRILWQQLNAMTRETLLGHGRVYGGGMHKLEPKELANIPADTLAAVAGLAEKHGNRQLELAGMFSQ